LLNAGRDHAIGALHLDERHAQGRGEPDVARERVRGGQPCSRADAGQRDVVIVEIHLVRDRNVAGRAALDRAFEREHQAVARFEVDARAERRVRVRVDLLEAG